MNIQISFVDTEESTQNEGIGFTGTLDELRAYFLTNNDADFAHLTLTAKEIEKTSKILILGSYMNNELKTSQLAQFVEKLGVKIMPQDKKKGFDGMLERFIKNIEKPFVEKKINMFFNYTFSKILRVLMDESLNITDIYEIWNNELLPQFGVPQLLLWAIFAATPDNDELKEKRIADLFEIDEEFVKVFQDLIKGGVMILVMSDMLKADSTNQARLSPKYLENQMKRQERRAKSAQHDLLKQKQEMKSLRREVHTVKKAAEELVNDAAIELAQVKAEKAALEQQFQQDMMDILDILTLLSKKKVENAEEQLSNPLERKTICVVGDTGRSVHYKKIVEAHDARYIFIDGFEKIVKFKSAITQADGIVFLKGYSDHTHYNLMADNAICPFVVVEACGMKSMYEGLLAVSQKINPSNRKIIGAMQ